MRLGGGRKVTQCRKMDIFFKSFFRYQWENSGLGDCLLIFSKKTLNFPLRSTPSSKEDAQNAFQGLELRPHISSALLSEVAAFDSAGQK